MEEWVDPNPPKKKKSKKPLVVLIIGILIGLGFILYQPIMDWLKGREGEQAALVIKEQILNDKKPESEDRKITAGVGVIEVPSVKINMPIYPHSYYDGLEYGARIELDDMHIGDDNLVLAGHSTYQRDLLFSNLDLIEQGADIIVYDEFATYTYKKISDEIIWSTDLKILEQPTDGKKYIHLFNCYPRHQRNTPRRLVVKGELKDTKLTKKGEERAAEERKKSEEQLKAEESKKQKEREDALKNILDNGGLTDSNKKNK